jgi:ribosomal protein S18 acetylase RimI-like enzyme
MTTEGERTPATVGVTVRAAAESERAAIQRVIDSSYAEFEAKWGVEPWTTAMTNLAKVIAQASPSELIVAEAGSGLVGTVTYYSPGPKDYKRVPEEWAVIRALGVAPEWRSRGVARLLTEECLRRARADNAPAVGLHTADGMDHARRMYEGIGFQPQHDFPHLGMRFWIYALYLTDRPS